MLEGTKSVKVPIVDCSSDPCNNGGSCIDVDNHFICNCPPGWYGAICDKEVIKCSSNPCSDNGECEDKENEFFCKCKTGWKGENHNQLIIIPTFVSCLALKLNKGLLNFLLLNLF